VEYLFIESIHVLWHPDLEIIKNIAQKWLEMLVFKYFLFFYIMSLYIEDSLGTVTLGGLHMSCL
jgi:hypothetical protein